jgi:hypothetical protein
VTRWQAILRSNSSTKTFIHLLALSQALFISLPGQLACAQNNDSDWVEGDVEEIRMRPNQSRMPGPPPRPVRPAPVVEEDYGQNRTQDPGPADRGQNDQSYQQPNQGYGASARQRPAPVQADELELSPPAPTVKVNLKNKSNVITGGISSSTFRGNSRSYRGLDKQSSQFMLNAPFLETPKTAAIQPSAFKLWLDKSHPGASSRFTKETIVEIKGKWDDCGHILHNFALPSTKVPSSQLAKTDLTRTKILLVNCGANFDSEALQKIREFVEHGGYLLSTDWALDSCIAKAFPGFVQWNNGYTENSVVDAVVVDDDPILLAGVPRVAHWKLENRSQTVEVRNREVQVLARSRFLKDNDASNLGILALTFPFGDGRILHLVGHFDNNADRAFNNALPDPAPIIGISLRQAIAANFIAASLDGDMTGQDGSENGN